MSGRPVDLYGDGQGDRAGHGGEQRAVFAYQIESYRHWEEQLKRTDFVHGQFGENFAIEGLTDHAVCIGDRYQVGSALFEVSHPRVTCYRVGIRMNEPRMPALLTASAAVRWDGGLAIGSDGEGRQLTPPAFAPHWRRR